MLIHETKKKTKLFLIPQPEGGLEGATGMLFSLAFKCRKSICDNYSFHS